METLLDIDFYALNIWLAFQTSCFLFALAIYSWRRRSVPGALPFAAGALFAKLSIVGILCEHATAEPAMAAFWLRFQLFWHLSATLAITGFIFDYI